MDEFEAREHALRRRWRPDPAVLTVKAVQALFQCIGVATLLILPMRWAGFPADLTFLTALFVSVFVVLGLQVLDMVVHERAMARGMRLLTAEMERLADEAESVADENEQ